jgi:type IV secretory pathway VirB6-like protein
MKFAVNFQQAKQLPNTRWIWGWGTKRGPLLQFKEGQIWEINQLIFSAKDFSWGSTFLGSVFLLIILFIFRIIIIIIIIIGAIVSCLATIVLYRLLSESEIVTDNK